MTMKRLAQHTRPFGRWIQLDSFMVLTYLLPSAQWRSANHKIVIRLEKQATVNSPVLELAYLTTTKTEYQVERALLLDVVV